MDLFEIKRINELDWEDIPFVEHPSFGFTRTFDAFNNPNNPWQRVINLREFIAAEFGNYDPIQHYAHTEDRLRDMMHDGHYLSICRTGKPFVAAFEWKENPAHPHNGEWIDAHRFFCGGRFIKLHLDNITHQWHTRKARTFMDELMETPFALAKEKVQEYIPAPPRVSQKRGEQAVAVTNVVVSEKVAPNEANATEQPKPPYKVLKGKYGTLHDYGDHIVHWDIDKFEDSNQILSSYTGKHECYSLGDGFGLPNTTHIKPGRKLSDFGGEIPDKTIFATFVDNGKGKLVYPSTNNGLPNLSGHLFVYDKSSGGYSPLENSVSVYHQYKRGDMPNKVHKATMQNDPSNSSTLAKHLDKYYAVIIN
ncbi:hypothetical protein D0C16_18460 [Cellvibrio sp. KY-GH-1]|uniref:hypothetical protein n=1 Tax=Cellvibrio sp. KY-GH-1 TaxID=2303332 RepID=UPI001247349C|nr:hypothetical protein [Cellvibrio sp. KY-GH-1]QEY17800.1 hypothetical protein D0C16_18460 [Cellvibrio sp. KY-GH-1]